ncbi:unnamed protein product [Ixodes hexagonus]
MGPWRPRSLPVVHGGPRGIWSRRLACTARVHLVLNVRVHLRPPHLIAAESLHADDPWMHTMQCLQYLSSTRSGDHNSVTPQDTPLVHRDLMLSLLKGLKLATQTLQRPTPKCPAQNTRQHRVSPRQNSNVCGLQRRLRRQLQHEDP